MWFKRSSILFLLVVLISLAFFLNLEKQPPYRLAGKIDCVSGECNPIPSKCKDDTQLPSIENHEGYSIAFIEFSDVDTEKDKGNCSETTTNQINHLKKLLKTEVQEGELDIILPVFIHGWQHSAKKEDSNVIKFRNYMHQISQLSKFELAQFSRAGSTAKKEFKFIAIYVGWRGSLIDKLPFSLNSAIEPVSFWNRKQASAAIGSTKLKLLLTELATFKKDIQLKNEDSENWRAVNLVFGAHSFGAQMLWHALSETIIQQERDSPEYGGHFGDMIIMINPAFESAEFEQLHNVHRQNAPSYKEEECSFNDYPKLVILQSENDVPTKFAFPLVRVATGNFSRKDRTAVGHDRDYAAFSVDLKKNSQCERDTPYKREFPSAQYIINVINAEAACKRNQDSNCYRKKMSTYPYVPDFCYEQLIDNSNYFSNQRYPIIRISEEISDGHGEIENPVLWDLFMQFSMFRVIGGDGWCKAFIIPKHKN